MPLPSIQESISIDRQEIVVSCEVVIRKLTLYDDGSGARHQVPTPEQLAALRQDVARIFALLRGTHEDMRAIEEANSLPEVTFCRTPGEGEGSTL